jgi:xylulokinase
MRSMGGVGASVEWLLKQFWPDLAEPSARYQALNQAAASSPSGSNGLIFTPLTGGHLETGELANRGLLGLSLNHTRGDISRAILEGITLELSWMLDEIRQATAITRLKMIGGASRSPVWPQIVADLTQIPIDLPLEPEAASLGAAILAGVGVGWYSDPVSAYGHFHIKEQEVLPANTLREWSWQLNQRYRQLWKFLPHHTENRFEGISR